jgi:HNH endonuclease
MRRVIKRATSEIIVKNLKYVSGNSVNNKIISEILQQEQKSFCAYTDEYISRTDAKDIEHFNPNLKDTGNDNYQNLFLVKHLWNKEKKNKWVQPILHPTATDFETRIIYSQGDYIANQSDIEAQNLIALLKLDDPALAKKRKKYIARKRTEILTYGLPAHNFFTDLINADICQVSYLRAIKEEFGIDLWAYLP